MALSKPDTRFTRELIDWVQGVIDGDAGSLTKWNKISKSLSQAHILYKQRLPVWEVMVHPRNREGLGLNTFDVHKVLATIKRIGADPAAVHRATAFEMAPEGPERQAQVAFNSTLVERSGGFLAALRGSERVLSVACSHFTAGCRASANNCESPEESLQDANGRINLEQLLGDDIAFEDLIKNGWEWTILPHCCQIVWPKLPDLVQEALNAEHATFRMSSELQVMVSIGNKVSQAMAQGIDVDWKRLKDDVTAAAPPCVEYMDPIIQYVKSYSGGEGAPIIRFLEGFAKEYGGSKKLGETFLRAVASARFPTESSKFPFVRAAMLATNLVSPQHKIVDGVAKLLSKTDVAGMASKRMLAKATAAEQSLSEIWSELQDASKARQLSVGQCNALFGRIAFRLILHLLKKENDGPVITKFESIAAIKVAFYEEKCSELGIEPANQAASGSNDSAPSDSGEVASIALSSLDDVSNPQSIAEAKGFLAGKNYIEHGGDKVFKLMEFSGVGAEFEEFTLAPVAPVCKSVGFEELKAWRLHSRTLPVKLAADITSHMAGSHLLLKQDLAKASCFTELMQLAGSFSCFEQSKLDYFFYPSEVRAKELIAKNKLWLIPTTDIGRIVPVRCGLKSGSSPTATSALHKFVLDAPMRGTKPPTAEAPWDKKVVMSAFWWIKTTDDQAEGNLKRVTKSVGDWTFDILENSKAIKPFEKLYIYEPVGPATKKARA